MIEKLKSPYFWIFISVGLGVCGIFLMILGKFVESEIIKDIGFYLGWPLLLIEFGIVIFIIPLLIWLIWKEGKADKDS